MKCGWIGIVLCVLLLIGCRQEDWKETSFEAPTNVEPNVLIETLRALDRETPPVVRVEQSVVHVRYNSMHVAIRNFTHVCDELAAKEEVEK
jgi:hypothetical protein